MKKPRAKHTPEFKAKVALAAIQEQETVTVIARKFKVHPAQIYKWKQELLQNMSLVFESKGSTGAGGAEASEREAELLKKIGELTVERDFLANGLGRFR